MLRRGFLSLLSISPLAAKLPDVPEMPPRVSEAIQTRHLEWDHSIEFVNAKTGERSPISHVQILDKPRKRRKNRHRSRTRRA